MGLTLGGNNSSFKSLRYLSESKSKMDKSLLKIASGKRILTAADDSGGLSVAMKLQNQINTTKAAQDRVENSKSFVEMQDTALSSIADIVQEMISVKDNYELKVASNGANSAEAKAYANEFRDLQVQLGSMTAEKFNGVSLFSSHDSESKTIYTSSSGSSGASVTLDNLDIHAGLSAGADFTKNLGKALTSGSAAVDGVTYQSLDANNFEAISVSNISEADLDSVFTQISALRAEAGGDLSTLGFASDYLSNMTTNMESAHGRIMDVDLAEESANYAKYSMQYEAAAAAVAQANVAMGAVLDLLLSSVNRD